jgi:hypothetical protein
VLVTILRAGISSAFFRFYFDSKDRRSGGSSCAPRSGSRWRARRSGSSRRRCSPSRSPTCSARRPDLVRAGFVGVWAQMNYEQLTSLFRVEERSTAFVLASLANIAITIGATILLVVVWEQGALGVIVGNFTGTLTVYSRCSPSPRAARAPVLAAAAAEMNRFGIPLVPAALALIASTSATASSSSTSRASTTSASTRSASGSRRRWCCS